MANITSFQIPQDIVDSVHAKLAAKLGITVEEYRQRLKADLDKHWCACPEEKKRLKPTVFHDNGRMTNQHCVRKHHWHCGSCKKLVQVG